MTPNPLLQRLASIAALAALWLLLSGHYNALLLSLGAASVLFVTWLNARMELDDHEVHPYHLHAPAVLRYLPWLAKEVVMSALDVSRRVLSSDMGLNPQVLHLPVSQRTDVGRTVYANSITLTPGTVSIDLSDTHVEVHALTPAGADSLASGDMDRRVAALERQQGDGAR